MNKQRLPQSEFQFIKSLFSMEEKFKFFGCAFSLIVGQALYIFLPALLGLLIDGIFIKGRWSMQVLI